MAIAAAAWFVRAVAKACLDTAFESIAIFALLFEIAIAKGIAATDYCPALFIIIRISVVARNPQAAWPLGQISAAGAAH